MWYAHDGPDGWGWFWMVFMMVLVWLPLLFIAWWFARQLGPSGRSASGSVGGDRSMPHDEVDAREIARRAYARGEVSRERFLEIIADLQQSSDSGRERQGTDT